MARINLLPWRQEERERKNKEFLVLAGAVAAVAILGVLMGMTFLNTTLSNQQDANVHIEQENARLDEVAKEIATLEQQREEMLSRMKIIQDLQGQRSIPVRVWDDIARAVPQAMYLVGMKRDGDVITINGFADNPNTVSQLVRNLDASPWLSNSGVPNIQTEIQAYGTPAPIQTSPGNAQRAPLPEDTYIQFTVTTQVKPDTPAKEGENAGQSGAASQDPNAPALAPAPTDVSVVPPPAGQPVPSGQPLADPAATPAPAATDPATAPQPTAPAPTDPAAAPQPVPSSAPAPAAPSAGGQ